MTQVEPPPTEHVARRVAGAEARIELGLPASTVPATSASAGAAERAGVGNSPSTTATPTGAGLSPATPACSEGAPPPPARPSWAQQHPLDVAGPLGLLYLSCLDPLIALGAKRPLQEADMPPCPAAYRARVLQEHVAAATATEAQKASTRAQPVRFSSVLWRAYRRRWLVAFCLDCVLVTCNFLQPFWLGALLRWIGDKAAGRYVAGHNYFMGATTGYSLAGGLVATSFIAMTCTNHAFFHQALFALSLRSSIMTAIFEKSMRLSPEARRRHSTGSIVTMMSVDAERVYQGGFTSQWLWMGPAVILGSAALTIRVLGLAGLVGAVLTVSTLVFQTYMAKQSGDARSRLITHTDERIKLMTELLQGIRVIKMYCWERPMGELVDQVRQREVRELSRLLWVKFTAIVVLFLAPTLISVLTFSLYMRLAERVRLDEVFAGLAFMNIIRLPMSALPQATSGYADLRVAMKRIDRFMQEKELVRDEADDDDQPSPQPGGGQTQQGKPAPPTKQGSSVSNGSSGDSEQSSRSSAPLPPPAGAGVDEEDDVVVSIRGGCFSWDGAPPPQPTTTTPQHPSSTSPAGPGAASPAVLLPPTLQDIDLTVRRGQLVCIVGPVGAGKSSLVAAMLGEMHRLAGTRKLRARVAYVSQEAWIQNRTVRDCILFDRPMRRRRYETAVKASQLRPDLAILPNHDMTEIGERGINLSGGQKARISLARALNESSSDLYIFDDPLSAVDAHVSRAIFEKALLGALRGQTRVLVLSSNYHFLDLADVVVLMDRGRVLASGPFSQLLERFPSHFNLEASASPAHHRRGRTHIRSRQESLDEILLVNDDEDDDDDLGRQAEQPKPEEGGAAAAVAAGKGRLVEKEERETGDVRWGVYVSYFSGGVESSLGGLVLALSIVGLFLLGQAGRVAVDYLLAQWSEDASRWSSRGERDRHYWGYAGTYWGLCALTVAILLGRTRLLLWATITSCSRLHSRLLLGVLRAPVNRYLDVVPVGRILNKFSKDLDAVDQPLPETLLHVLQNLSFVASIVALCLTSTPWFLVFFAPIILLFVLVYHVFHKTSRELKRIESTSRSPIYSSFAEMLQGIEVIRAYRRSTDFLQQHLDRVDANAALYLTFWLTSRWLAIRLDFLAVLVMLVLSLLAAVLVETGHQEVLSPAMLSLALIYCLQLTGLLQWTIRLVVDTEVYMTSVERLTSFLQLPCEAPLLTDVRPPPDWPSEGSVEIRDLSLRYRPGLDLVLRGLDLHIKGGEKVGVCGRTGAGKSSLTQALFRLVEAEEDGSSRISIDGIDIRSLGLDDLRSRLTIIPQDPVLFSGTLRMNLDPFNERTDYDIWEALRRVNLEADVRGLPEQLHSPVAEKGSNFSLGQRQLLCIARALLRRSKVLIMDEATASVDTETDRRIQETIRKNFTSNTVICIAHRLETIIDFTKIVVMDKGKVIEYDHPARLLERPDSVFAGMVAELGPETAEVMKQTAMKALADQQARQQAYH